jgi:hypothetical protein
MDTRLATLGSLAKIGVSFREGMMPQVSMSIMHVEAGRTILRWSLVITLLIALALVVAGCVLVYLGAVGHSEIELFGNKLSTASVGVVGIFCGTILGVLNTRRTLKALERLAALP